MDVKVIPFTKGYLASKTGVIYDPHGNERKQYVNGDGYRTASVVTDNGIHRTFGVHRLVALAHIPLPINASLVDFTVNHKNKNITDNRHSNLEWVSVKKNNSHAALMSGSNTRPRILAKSPDGKFEFISNLHAAAIKFECDIDLVWECIKDERPLNGWFLSHHTTKSIIPNELRKENFPGGRGKGPLKRKEIQIMDITTREIKSFASYHEAAVHFGVSASHIYQAECTFDNPKLFKRNYLIVPKGCPFPELNDSDKQRLLGPTGKKVLAYNTNTGKYVIYDSASQFIKENGLSKKAVTVDLKKNRFRENKNWFYTYMNQENAIRLKSLLEGPNF